MNTIVLVTISGVLNTYAIFVSRCAFLAAITSIFVVTNYNLLRVQSLLKYLAGAVQSAVKYNSM